MRFFFLFKILFLTTFGYGQDFQWARQFGNTQDDRIIDTEIDNNGNTYLIGESTSYSFDLNPNAGTEIIGNNNSSTHGNICFITKLDSNGNYVWGKVFNNTVRSLSDKVFEIKIGSDNNIYVLMDVYTYTGNQTLVNAQNVLVKLDTNGNELFVKTIKNLNPVSSSNYIKVTAFDLDSSNNIFLGGYFFGNTVVLDLSNSQYNLTSSGAGVFALKMDNNGNYLWKLNPPLHTSGFTDIIVRPDGNVNIAFNSTYPTLVCRFLNVSTTNGTILWEKNYDNILFARTFDIANNGNIMLSCINLDASNDPVDVDTGSNSYFTSSKCFLLCLNSSGDFITVKEYFTDNIWISIVKSDPNNNFYVAGNYTTNSSSAQNYSFDADPSANTFILTTYPTQLGEGFCIKFDSSFEFENAFLLGQADVPPTMYDNIYSLRFTNIKFKNSNSYFTGYFNGYGDLNPTNEVAGFSTNHGSGTLNNDGFILKMGPCETNRPNGDPNQYFCSNQNARVAHLSPNSNSIKWYDSLTSTTQLAATTALVDGQIYYAAKQVGSCPESTDRLAVTVHIQQTPQAPIASNQAFCERDNATVSSLLASGQNLNWYSTQLGGPILPPTTILQNNTIYYVSQTVNNCESDRTPITVTITPNQIPALTSPQQFCIQQNATLNNITITGQNIKWYDDLTAGNLLVNTTLLQNGMTYYASQTINSCESTRVLVKVTIQNTPAPTGNTVQSFCSSQNATINDITVSGSNLIWYDSVTGTTVLPSTTLLANNTAYFVTQTVNGCESPTRFSVTVTLINTLNANDYAETFCDDSNDGTETVDLSDYNTHLISSTANHTFTYYTSQNGAENQSTADAITNFGNYNLTVGLHTVYVRIDSPNGCHQVVELALTLFSKPIIPITDIMPICEGSSIDVSAGNGFDSYTWSTAETTSLITISDPGNYSVTVTQNNGTLICTSVKNFTVVNSNVATVSEIVTSDWTYNQNTITVLLTGSSVGNYVYSLDGVHYQTSNTFTGLESGEYIVYVKDKNGCGIQPEDFYLLMYPKFFTPNGDGYNDSWKIKFSENEPNLTVKIFDRYGKLMKQLGSNSEGWNGTYNSQPLPATDYWFVVTRRNGKEYRGHFTLKR